MITRSISAPPFRLAICNEVFQGWNFVDACRTAKAAGYSGLEIAPFTLSDNPAFIPASQRKLMRAVLKDEGLQFVGLHLLLHTPAGLHVTTKDDARRIRSWDHMRQLTDLCAELGEESIMVFGSAKQRSANGDSTIPDAVTRLRDGLAALAPSAHARNVTLLIEPLSPRLTDVVTTLPEAIQLVKTINHPAVETMFDFHNADAENDAHSELIRQHSQHIRHIHLNETDGRHPGSGSSDFKPVLQALKQSCYSGWISVEVFDFKAGGERIATDSARFLRQEEAKLASAA